MLFYNEYEYVYWLSYEKICLQWISPYGLEVIILSDFRPKEVYYML